MRKGRRKGGNDIKIDSRAKKKSGKMRIFEKIELYFRVLELEDETEK